MTKINYKGAPSQIGVLYTYICGACEEERDTRHGMQEQPEIICTCGEAMHRKPAAPAFDADLHDSMKTHNLGWDYDGTGE
jgi:DNA-directed RNA polymerase subunit RPC12/RpoP